MRFDDLDAEMRKFETLHDRFVDEKKFLVARLDGRNFTGLSERLELRRPFDDYMNVAMVEVMRYLMERFSCYYGYTQSDEISLFFSKTENSFNLKYRKLLSVMAGEASAAFSQSTRVRGAFDCRLSELPTVQRVVDYFRWRGSDSLRNSLSSYCFWTLVNEDGQSKRMAASMLNGLNDKKKKEILKAQGVDFDSVPRWQKYGVAMYYKPLMKRAVNLATEEECNVNRRELVVDRELPEGDDYSVFLKRLFAECIDWNIGP